MKQFTILEFNKEYPNNEKCLEEIFKNQKLKSCPKCQQKSKFYKIKNRPCYSCSECNYQHYPLKGTIFEGSSTSLKLWFFALYLISSSKNGVSSKELQRQLGVTYKTAWRMNSQIRLLFKQKDLKLKGTIEVDEMYMGGRKRYGKVGRGTAKSPVIGLVERKGRVVAKVVPHTRSSITIPLIQKHVDYNARVVTDDYVAYRSLRSNGYKEHDIINHSDYKYVVGDIYTNTIEGFWGHMKRSVRGTYVSVSKKHLPSYVDQFAYVYNHRSSKTPLFSLLLSKALKPL